MLTVGLNTATPSFIVKIYNCYMCLLYIKQYNTIDC